MPITLEKIEAIRRRAIEINPSLREIEFGDYVTGNGLHNARVIRIKDEENVYVWRNGSRELELINIEDERYQIEGRPIRLADILLVISDKEKFSSKLRFMAINGCFYEDGIILAQYDLLHDDLTLQKPEVIDFIYELIK